MSGLSLLDAHVAKARLTRRIEEATRAVCEASVLLARLAQGRAEPSALAEVQDLAVEAFREQLRLVVEAAEVDRAIEEAERG